MYKYILPRLYEFNKFYVTIDKGDCMPMSDAQYRATKKYNAKSYDRIEISVYKGEKQKIKEYAEKKGLSVNAYITELIRNDMQPKTKKELL